MKEIDLSEKEATPPTPDLGVYHVSVLARELIQGIGVQPQGCYLDATLGGGGHTRLIVEAAPDVTVIAIDRDLGAIQFCQQQFDSAVAEGSLPPDLSQRLQFWHGNFADYQPKDLKFDGIIADLGVSSAQLDTPARGFSFRHPANLDMRMNQQQSLTAADIVNGWEEAKLADIFYTYGEERLSRRIAKRIVSDRPFRTTVQLAESIAASVPRAYRYGRIHPATRVFQALRIAVNAELASLETFLARSPQWLKPGGRIGTISFHSLEDRLVKHGLRNSPILQVLTKKPICPQAEEIARNARARSAKLRIAERVNLPSPASNQFRNNEP